MFSDVLDAQVTRPVQHTPLTLVHTALARAGEWSRFQATSNQSYNPCAYLLRRRSYETTDCGTATTLFD